MEFIDSKVKRIEKDELVSLSSSEKEYLKRSYKFDYYDYYFKKYNGIIYHCKNLLHRNMEVFINEFIGQIVSGYFNLPVVKSDIYKTDKNYYMLTRNFIDINKKYKNISNDIFPDLSFYDISPSRLKMYNLNNFGLIRKTSGEDIYITDEYDLKLFLYHLKAMIVSDFIRGQKDRVCRNFMIEINKNHVKLCPLYDFEHSFLYTKKSSVDENVFDFDITSREIRKLVRKDSDFQQLLYLAFNLNFDNILEELFYSYGVNLNKEEIEEYSNIIQDNKKKIKARKLVR